MTEKLIFIYNANSGAKNMVLDAFHKAFSPATYDCKLCEITFGVFAENPKWKKFRSQSPVDMLFLHKDEFAKQYASKFGHKYTFPIVLIEDKNGLQVLMNTQEIAQVSTVNELINEIEERSANLD